MKITMTKDQSGSENGILINDYSEGKTYDMADSLANAFISDIRCARLATKDEHVDIVYEDAAAQVRAGHEAVEKNRAEAEAKKKAVDAEAEARADEVAVKAKVEADAVKAKEEAEAKAKTEADAIEAKAQEIRGDPAPDENTADAPDEQTVVTEDKVETPDDPDIIMSSDGSPYLNKRTARAALARKGLKETHEEVVVKGGYGLRVKQTPKRTRGD